MLRLRQYVEHLRGIFTAVSDGCRRARPESPTVTQYVTGSISQQILSTALCVSIFASGCSTTQKVASRDLQWADGDKPTQWYKDHNTAIEYPLIDNETAEAVQVTEEPRSLQRRVDDEVREMSLDEAILLALQNNKLAETTQIGGVGGTFVLANPEQVSTVYDSAIQETGVLFGRRGMEAALADFDTRFSTSMNWGRTAQGSHSLAPTILGQDTGTFRSGLDKSLASGGAISVYHNWDYLGNNIGTPLYPSSYSGTLGAQVRQPLLAGAGTEFTRVAGPTRPGFGAIAGVSQGVVIARINQDITIADFEIAVRNGLRAVEDYYWELYLAYRNYDNAVSFHESAFETWRVSRAKMEIGTLKEAEELQARDEFYKTRALVETGLNQVYRRESDLRRALGLPMNDGTVLRPSMEPVKAEFKPDWESCLTNGLTRRVELRRQKWQIKSLQLQLNAARSLVRPQLDVVGNYGVNGFGDKLISQNGSSGYGSMTGDNLDTWTMGVEMSMPIGFRQARSQVKNYELQIARANAILEAQERSVAHDIAISIQDVTVAWAAAQSNLNRLHAAERRVELLKVEVDSGTAIVDVVVRAQSSMADAEKAYYEQLVAYNKAITYLNLATGTLLDVYNVHLAEGSWSGEAYEDAKLRADARTHAKDAPNLETLPHEFASPTPTTSVERRVSQPGVQE